MNAIKMNKEKNITVPARARLKIETKREKEYEKFANDRIREQSHFCTDAVVVGSRENVAREYYLKIPI